LVSCVRDWPIKPQLWRTRCRGSSGPAISARTKPPPCSSHGGGPKPRKNALHKSGRPHSQLAGGGSGPARVERELERRTQSVLCGRSALQRFQLFSDHLRQCGGARLETRLPSGERWRRSERDFVCVAPSGDKPILVIEYDWTLTVGQLQITRSSPNLCHWGLSGTTRLKRSGS